MQRKLYAVIGVSAALAVATACGHQGSSPVAPSGAKPIVSVEEVGNGWWQVVTRFTVEVEGSEKPACVADSVGRALVAS